jgi:1-deoxy-D-xylulose-5-phosphate reductoisomerase
MAKRIAILGSTGSIGKNAIRVIESLGPEYRIDAISANSNIQLLAEQAQKYKPRFVAVSNKKLVPKLRALLEDSDIEILSGSQSLITIASLDDIDIVLVAVVGAAGLPPSLAAAMAGKHLAIANKESLVIAGELLMKTAQENGCAVLPVDSEHSAIFQAILSGKPSEVKRLILTASGGPFRMATPEEIQHVTLEQALAHPIWNMGTKITIDSATMINKAFELIEARWLFNTPVDKIDILVHPESIIHSLVEFVDGSVIAQMGLPDMCLPIQYALTYPLRVPGIAKPVHLETIGRLTFEKPNMKTFRALSLGYEVARTGGTAPAVFNAANETAVEEFLAGRIKFVNIIELIEDCLNKHTLKSKAELEDIFEADTWARKEVAKRLKTSRINNIVVQNF